MLIKTYSLRPHCVSCWTIYILQNDTRTLQCQVKILFIRIVHLFGPLHIIIYNTLFLFSQQVSVPMTPVSNVNYLHKIEADSRLTSNYVSSFIENYKFTVTSSLDHTLNNMMALHILRIVFFK